MIDDGSWRQAKIYVTNSFDFQTKTNFLDKESWEITLLESEDLKLLDKEENDILVIPENIGGTYRLNYTGSEVDDLLSYVNQLKNGGGGGGGDGKAIVDVEELPKASWSGIAVPNSGTVENVYFNTNLSVEEVVNIIDFIPNESFSNFFGSTVYLVIVDELNEKGIMLVKGNESIDIVDMSNNNIIFSSNVGWNINQNVYEINANVINQIDEETPIGTQNELLSSLFSTTPFEENKPNDKVIYRLPNGKLFEYNPIEKDFIQILNDKNFETISESLIGTEPITTKEDELIEKIYINNKMSIEEVESACSNLIMGAFAFSDDLNSQEGHIINIINYDKYLPDYGGGLGITIVYQYLHQVGIEMAVDEHILFASGFVASDYGINGWNPDENISEIVLNACNMTKEYLLGQNTEEDFIAELGMTIDEYIDKQNKELINLISSKPFVKAKDVVIKGKEDEILYPETKVSNVKGLDSLLEQAANKLNHYVKIDIEGEITFDEEIYNKIVSALKQNKVVLVDWNTEKSDYSIASLGPVLYRGTVYSMSGGAEMLPYDNDVKFVMQFTIKNEIHLYYWNRRTETVTKEVLSKEIIEVDELPLLEDKPESCYIYSPLGINIVNPYAQTRILTLDELPDLSQTFTNNELEDNNIGICCYTNRVLYYFDYESKTWNNVDVLDGFKGYINNISEGSFSYDEDDMYSFYVVRESTKTKEDYDPNKLYKIKETRCSIVYSYPRFIIEELMYKSMFEIIPCKNLPTIGKPFINYVSIISDENSLMTAYYEESSKSLKVYIPKIMAEFVGNEGWVDALALISVSEIELKGIIYNRKELEDKEEGAYILVETENNIYEIDNVNKIYNRLNGNNIVNIPANLESTILVLDDEQVKKIKYGTNVELNTIMIRPFTLSNSLFEQGKKVFSCSYLDFFNYETLNTTFINVDLILLFTF